MNPNHYEVLGVAETSSISEIKAAYRSLVLQLHPDKQQLLFSSLPTLPSSSSSSHLTLSSAATTTTTVPVPILDDSSKAFIRIQRAWECLRDSKSREDYNQTLLRNKAKLDKTLQLQHAQVIYLSDMKCELCVVEEEEEEDNEVDHDNAMEYHPMNRIHPKQNLQSLYTLPCRCGDQFEILQEELSILLHDERKDSLPDQRPNSIHGFVCDDVKYYHSICKSCSLAIKIVTPPIK